MKNFNKYLKDNILKKYDHLRTKYTFTSFWVPKGMEKEMVKFFINSKLSPVIHLLPKTEEKSWVNINSVTFSLYPEDLSYHEQVEDLIVLALKQKLTVTIFKNEPNYGLKEEMLRDQPPFVIKEVHYKLIDHSNDS